MNTPRPDLALSVTPQIAQGSPANPADHLHDYRRVVRYVCECGTERAPYQGGRPKTDRHETWKAAYDAGESIEAIALATNRRYGTVRDVLRRLGASLPDRRGQWSRRAGSADPARDEEVRRLAVDEHLTYSDVGLRLGITRERVRQVLAKRFGIDTHALTLASNEARRAARPPVIITCRFCGTGYVQGTYTAHRRAAGSGHKRPTETAARGARIVADYQAGMLVVDIMSKYGVAASRIMRDLEYAGVPTRRPRTSLPTRAQSRARKDAIAAAIASGRRRVDIARTFGVSDAWVGLIAKERGLRCGVVA